MTGAASMLGAALIAEALKRNTEIYAVVRPGTGHLDRLPKNVLLHIIEEDIDRIGRIRIPLECDTFFHFAWQGTDRQERNNPSVQQKNIKNTLDAARLAKQCGCRVFIGAGSQAEYGEVRGIIDEKTKFDPNTAYGAAKFAAGRMSRILCDDYNMIHIWGRVFSVYGKNDSEDTMLKYAIDCFLKHKKAYFSSGRQVWDYLYEEDAGMIFYLLGEKAAVSKEYRIAGGQARELRWYIEVLAKEMNAQKFCVFRETDSRLYGIQADTVDLEHDIGYRPLTDFSEGIRKVITEIRMQRMVKAEGFISDEKN